MHKQGPDVSEEGEYCRVLGRDVCPEIHGVVRQDGYFMEFLDVAERTDGLLVEIESLLFEHVWRREPFFQQSPKWRENLESEFSIPVPEWVDMYEQENMTHGDPTTSNALRRDGKLILGDPVTWRRYVPQYSEVDMGKILQSALGWETVAYGEIPVLWKPPAFWQAEPTRKRALFWCAIHACRILRREKQGRLDVIKWCMRTREVCRDLAGF